MSGLPQRVKPLAFVVLLVLPLGTASAHHRRATTYDDNNPAIVYSQGQNGDGTNGWHTGSDGNDFGGGEHYTNAYTGSFVVHFIGTDFQWIGKRGPNFGIASLFLDGNSVGTVDAYSPSVQYQQVLYGVSGLANQAHTFCMKIGTYPNPAKNGASSGWYQVMDGFTTSGTPLNLSMISPANGSVQKAGSWSFGPNDLSGQYCWSNDRTTPASLTLPFSGTGFEIYGHPEGEDGMFDVYIDGSYITTVDQYNPLLDSVLSDSTNDTLYYAKTGLAAGNHTLKVVVSKNKNAAATDYYTQIDGFIVLPAGSSGGGGGGGGGTGGALSGTSSGSSGGINLTSAGTSDWAYWEGWGNFEHKASGGGQISNVALVGGGGNYGGYAGTSRSVSWSDGTPTGSGSDDAYIWSNGAIGSGFSFTVPADTSTRTLMIFYGASDASVTVSAHLSDGSASDYSNSHTGPGAWLETINYHAGGSGKALTITVLKTGNNSGFTNGSADLVAAMLQSGSGGGGGGGGGVVGNGSGLTGQYYDNIDFTNLKATRTDATVNFDWGSGSPDPSIDADTFSVRWTGQVQAQFSETYTFYTDSDDGIRLWVNNVLVINNWTDHAPTEDAGTISLSAGTKVSLKLEFYENGGGAMAKLLWSSPSTSKQVVPQTQLYPASVGGGSGGALSGTSGGSGGFNLTSTGTSDWAYWDGWGTFVRKSSGGAQISNASLIGSGGNYGGWSDSGRTVTWSDGTPIVSGTSNNYIWSNGALNSGFQFTAPADTSTRTLTVYFGASTATATLSAHLSDGSAADYVTSMTGPGAWQATITYHAASAGQILTVNLLKTGNNSGFTDGSADLMAAMLH